jgi:hypothetical protein
MLTGEDLLDPVLVDQIGSVDAPTLHQMVNICEEALIAVLGPGIAAFLEQDDQLAERAVPWAWDLARGLHYQSVCGPAMPLTVKLIDQLSYTQVASGDRDLIADRIDWAFILTEDRIAEFIQGRGAIRRDPIRRQHSFPWYARLQIGYRIRLTTEALRLMPQ